MADRLLELNEKFKISLGVVCLIASIAYWAGGFSSETQTAKELAAECVKNYKLIDERLSRIEGHLFHKEE